jgi:hypothetical protein
MQNKREEVTPLDDSFTLILGVIVYVTIVSGMLGLALSKRPRDSQHNCPGPQENSDPANSHQTSADQDEAVINGDHAHGTQNDSGGHENLPMSEYEWRSVILTSLIAGVTALYALISTLQLNAMRTSNTLIRKQFEAADRPWVKLLDLESPTITFAGPSFHTKLGKLDGAFLNVVPKIKNIGRSTATHIRVETKLVLHKWGGGWGNFISERNSVCDALSKEKDSGADIVLFPDDPFDEMGNGSGEILKPSNISGFNEVRYIAPALVGCIDYQFQSSQSHHQTAFVYEIFRADDRSRIFVLGEDMTPSQINLIRDAQYDTAN